MAQKRSDDNVQADLDSRRVTLGNDPTLTMQRRHGATPGGNIEYFSNRSRYDNSHISGNGYQGGRGYYASRDINLNRRRSGGRISASDSGKMRNYQNLWCCPYCNNDNWIKDFNVLGNIDPCSNCRRAGPDFVWGNDEVVKESLKITGNCDMKRKRLVKRLKDLEDFDEKSVMQDWGRLNDKEVFLKNEVKEAQKRVDDAEKVLKDLRADLSGCVNDLGDCRDKIEYSKEKMDWKRDKLGSRNHLHAKLTGIDTEESGQLRLVQRNVSDIVASKCIFVWHNNMKVPYHQGKGMGLSMNNKMKSRNWLYFARADFRHLSAANKYMHGVIEEWNVGMGEGNLTIRLESDGDLQDQRAWSLVKFVNNVKILSADCRNVNCILDISASVGVKVVARAVVGGNYKDRAEAHSVYAADGAVIYGEIHHVCGLRII
eukprot:17966_1